MAGSDTFDDGRGGSVVFQRGLLRGENRHGDSHFPFGGLYVYTICAKVAFRNVDSRSGFSVVSIYTVAGLFILALSFGRVAACTQMGPRPWIYVAVSGVLSIALSHVLYYFAIKRIGATIPSLVLLLQPVIVLAISSVVFDERLNTHQWIFGAVLLAGSALAVLAQRRLNSTNRGENGLGRAR